MVTRLLALLVITLAAGACGTTGDDITVSDPGDTTVSPSGTATTGPVRHCTDDVLGYRITYPADWHVNDGEVLPACRLFDPEPIEVEAGTEVPFDIAVALRTSDHPLTGFTSDDDGSELLDSRPTVVDGHQAAVVERRGTGAALVPEGMRFTHWVVDLGDTRLVMSTYDTNGDYDTNRAVLDHMIASLGAEEVPVSAPCRSSESSTPPPPLDRGPGTPSGDAYPVEWRSVRSMTRVRWCT